MNLTTCSLLTLALHSSGTIHCLAIWDLAVVILSGLYEDEHSTANVHVAAKEPAAAYLITKHLSCRQ